jgi:hypothetical protein
LKKIIKTDKIRKNKRINASFGSQEKDGNANFNLLRDLNIVQLIVVICKTKYSVLMKKECSLINPNLKSICKIVHGLEIRKRKNKVFGTMKPSIKKTNLLKRIMRIRKYRLKSKLKKCKLTR